MRGRGSFEPPARAPRGGDTAAEVTSRARQLQAQEALAGFSPTRGVQRIEGREPPPLRPGRAIHSDERAPVTILEPGTMYGERLTQVDLRMGKILRFGRTKTSLNLDIYNLFNASTVLTVNNAYASWLRPTSILLARFAKVGMQIDF